MNVATLVNRLEALPSEIATAEEEATNAWEAYEREKAEYDNEKAKQYLQYKAKSSSATVKELESLVTTVTHEVRLKLIVAEAKFKRANGKVRAKDDEFTGLKKVLRWKEIEIRNLEYQKGGE